MRYDLELSVTHSMPQVADSELRAIRPVRNLYMLNHKASACCSQSRPTTVEDENGVAGFMPSDC